MRNSSRGKSRSTGDQETQHKSRKANESPQTSGGSANFRHDGEPLLDADGVAELLTVETGYVYDLVKRGAIPCLRVGRYLRFSRAVLLQWIEARIRMDPSMQCPSDALITKPSQHQRHGGTPLTYFLPRTPLR